MVKPLTSSVIIGVISLLGSFVYSRYGLLRLFIDNRPDRIVREINVSNARLLFADEVRNCEDVLLNEDHGWALMSCDPGRDTWNTVMGVFIEPKAPPETGLYIWDYANNPSSPPQKLKLLDFRPRPENFHPLGIDYEPSSKTLFVANHAESGSCIEVFRLYADDAAAAHIRTLKHKDLSAPNSIAALSPTELLVTNDHFFLARWAPILSTLETYLSLPLGSVLHIDLSDREEVAVNVLAWEPFPNGIVILNSTSVAVASTTSPSLSIYSMTREADTQKLQLERTLKLPLKHHIDNLSLDGNGKIIFAGHPHGPTLGEVSKKNHLCHPPATPEAEAECAALVHAPSWIQEWSEQEGLKTLYLSDAISSVCTAVRDTRRGIGIAPGLYAKGFLTWEEK